MEVINRDKAVEIRDRVVEALNGMSKELGIEFNVSRGTYTDAEITLKIKGNLLDCGGMVVTSTYENRLADEWANLHGINFSGDHFIGTLWDIAGRGICKVIEVSRRAKKFPVILSVVEGGKIKSTGRSLVKQIVEPSDIMFMDWLLTDIDEDDHSAQQEENYYATDTFMQAYFGSSPLYEKFIDLTNKIFDKGLSQRLWPYIYKMIFTDHKDLLEVITYMEVSLNN